MLKKKLTWVLILLLLIELECLLTSRRAKDLSGRIICTGVGSVVALQSFINIGVVTRILPNTGTPLPFVSYGLTSLLSLFIGMGLVLNVGLQGRVRFERMPERMYRGSLQRERDGRYNGRRVRSW